MRLNEQLLELIRHLNCADELITGTFRGEFKVKKGRFAPPLKAVAEGSWLHIEGSKLNDGLHQVGSLKESLKDEVFEGTIRSLSIEPHLLALAKEILEFNKKNVPTLKGGERFGAYSYTNAVGSNGIPAGWTEVFAKRLRPYRRMFSRVRV